VVQPSEFKGETIMFIGNFRTAGSSYTGVIKTLTFKTEAVFEPIEKKSEKSPDYRVTSGNTDIGVAWKETSEAGNAYLSVRLDDPALPSAIACRLVKTGAEHSHSLVWERPRKQA
jgi:uncharacterized protein (DUF736 family)